MPDLQTLLKMSEVSIDRIDPSTLIDIHSVAVAEELPHEQKILSVIEQMGNPYCFLSGDIPVRVRFTSTEKSLSESLVNYFSLLKQK